MTSAEILAQFRKLSPSEQRELFQAMLQQSFLANTAARHSRTLDEVLGKFSPQPDPEAKDHDRGFAEAILASKRGCAGQ